MKLPRDLLSGNYIAPDVFLCQTDKEIISKINVLNLNGTFKWSQYSELSFTMPRIYIDETTHDKQTHPAYDKVEALRLIYLDGFGYFQIQEPLLSSDGLREVKEVTAYSSEYALSQRYLDTFVINKGVYDNPASIDGVQLYNRDDPEHSLLTLVLREKAPDWTVGHVDPELATEQRSFEVDRQSIYDFLTNDVQDAFKCIVIFDTMTNTVNIYKEEEDEHYQTDIYVTFENLAKNVNISYSADDIKTMITVSGDEDLDIRNVNFGLPYILDLSYYYSVDWMGQKLYDRYTTYLEKIESQREPFKNLSLQISEAQEKILDLNWATSDTLTENDMNLFWGFLNDFYNHYDTGVKTKQAYIADAELLTDLTNAFYDIYTIYEKTKDTEIIEGKHYYEYDAQNNQYVLVNNPVPENLSRYYEKDEARETRWHNAWNAFTTTISSSDISESGKKNKDAAVLNILRTNNVTNPAPSIFGLLGYMFLQSYQTAYKEAQATLVSEGASKKQGWPTTANTDYHNYYAVINLLNAVNAELKTRKEEMKPFEQNIVVYKQKQSNIANSLSMSNNFDEDDIKRLAPFLREDEYSNEDYVVTDRDSYADVLKTEEELLKDAMTELHKISQPQLTFTENIYNLLALKEFAPIQYQFELGNFITTEIRPDYIKKTRLLEVSINFDNLSDISVVFGDLIDVKDQADTHADLLSQAITAGKQVASSAGHWTDGVNVATEMQNKLNQGLLDAATVLKSIDGTQNVEIDKYGIHLSTIDSGGDKSPKQGWIVNNQLAYTDDNWLTTKSVFGEFTYDNKTYWGVLADAVVAGYIEGSVIKGSEIYGGHIEGTEIIGGTGTFNGDLIMRKRLSDNTGYAVFSFKTAPYYDSAGVFQENRIGLMLENQYDSERTEANYTLHQVSGKTSVTSGEYWHLARPSSTYESRIVISNNSLSLATEYIPTSGTGASQMILNISKSNIKIGRGYSLGATDLLTITGGTSSDDLPTISPAPYQSMQITGTLILPNTTDAGSTKESNCALKIGNPSDIHLEFDTNEIIAKSTANTSNTLYLNESMNIYYHDGVALTATRIENGETVTKTFLRISTLNNVDVDSAKITSNGTIVFDKRIFTTGIDSSASIIVNNGIGFRSYNTDYEAKTLIHLNDRNNVVINGNSSGNTNIYAGTDINLQTNSKVSGTLSVSGRTTTAGLTTSGSIIPDTAAAINLGGVANGWQRIYIGNQSDENNGLYLAGTNQTDSYWLCGYNQHGHFTFGTTASGYMTYYQSRIRNTSNTGQSFRITNGAAENSSTGIVYDYDDPARVYIVGGADSTSTWVSIPPAYNRTVTSAANLYITNHGTLARSTSSSKRYKHDIRLADKYSDEMMSVLDIDVVKFKYNDGYVKDGNYHGEDVVGFIAEQIEEVSPDCVTYEDGKVESWNERIMIPKMLYVIQQQQKQIEKLQDIVSALERR